MRIIRDISISDCLPHHGLNHRIELKTDSPSMLDKDKQLLYDLIKRLLSISKITVPNVHTCVSYIITRMESPSICHENNLLQLDVAKSINEAIIQAIQYGEHQCEIRHKGLLGF